MEQYYRQKFAGNRSRPARMFDYILLRLLLLGAGYIFFLFQLRNRLSALLFSLIAVVLFSIAAKIVNNIRYEHFKKEFHAQLRDQILKDSMVIIPREEFLSICAALATSYYKTPCISRDDCIEGENIYGKALQYYSKNPCTAQDVLDFYQEAQQKGAKKAILLSTSGFNEEAKAMAEKIRSCSITLVGIKKLMQAMKQQGYAPNEEEIKNAIRAEIKKQALELKKIKSTALTPMKAKRYLMCAGLLLLSSFITGYGVYYRIVAAIMLALALLAYAYPKLKPRT